MLKRDLALRCRPISRSNCILAPAWQPSSSKFDVTMKWVLNLWMICSLFDFTQNELLALSETHIPMWPPDGSRVLPVLLPMSQWLLIKVLKTDLWNTYVVPALWWCLLLDITHTHCGNLPWIWKSAIVESESQGQTDDSWAWTPNSRFYRLGSGTLIQWLHLGVILICLLS